MIADLDIFDAIREHCLVYSTRKLPRGHVRIDTKLLYPDGAAICVFVERGGLAVEEGLGLSDFGKTLEKLAEYQLDPWVPESRTKTIREIIEPLDVQLVSDRLRLNIEELDKLSDGIITLSQACLRASCLILTKRASAPRTLAAEVSKIIEATGLPTESPYNFDGPYGNRVKVDYRVDSRRGRHSSILRLGGSHVQANEVLRKWHDLKRIGVRDQFATVFDEHQPVQYPEDLTRLQDFSRLFPLGDRDGLAEFLKAA